MATDRIETLLDEQRRFPPPNPSPPRPTCATRPRTSGRAGTRKVIGRTGRSNWSGAGPGTACWSGSWLSYGTSTNLRRRRRRRGGEGAAKGGNSHNPTRRNDHRRAHAPATDGVDHEELEIGQIDRKAQTDTRQTHEHHVPLSLR